MNGFAHLRWRPPATHHLIVDLFDLLDLNILLLAIPVGLRYVLLGDDLTLLSVDLFIVCHTGILILAEPGALHFYPMGRLAAIACFCCRLPTTRLIGIQVEMFASMFAQLLGL